MGGSDSLAIHRLRTVSRAEGLLPSFARCSGVLLGLALAISIAGCRPSRELQPVPEAQRLRLIESDPIHFFDAEEAHDYTEVGKLLFPDAGPGSWRMEPDTFELEAVDRGALQVRGTYGQLTIARDLEIDPEEVGAVQFLGHGLQRGTLSLRWRREGEPFSPERRLTLPYRNHSTATRVRFETADHPQWQGPIAGLQLEIRDSVSRNFLLREVSLLERKAKARNLAEVVSQPFKISLNREMRNAFVRPPGIPLVWDLRIPTHQPVLRFGLGLAGGQDPVTFRVRAGDQELFARTLDPTDEASTELSATWQDVEVDLSPLAGQEVGLLFEVESSVPAHLQESLPLWSSPEVVSTGKRPWNVLLISVDTLRADRLETYGYSRPTAPHLETWARRSAVTFLQTVASSSWTLPSHISMLSGQDALTHGINYHPPRISPTRLPDLLSSILRRHGWATAAITDGGYLRPRFGFATGFDLFRHWTKEHQDEMLQGSVDFALDFMKEHQEEAFFFFLHTYKVHIPYLASPACLEDADWPDPDGRLARRAITTRRVPNDRGGFRSILWLEDPDGSGRPIESEEDHALASTFYDCGITFTDRQLGRLFDGLEELDLADRTLVVVTSDHGEALGEKGHYLHKHLYDHTVLVPQMMSFPDGRGAGVKVERQVRSVDLLPTLLDALDLEIPNDIDGFSLLPLLDDPDHQIPGGAWSYAPFKTTGLALRLNGRFKYIANDYLRHPMERELYELRQDPQETMNLSGLHRSQDDLEFVVQDYWEGRGGNLGLSVSNAGPGTFRGWLDAEMAQRTTTRSLDTPPRTVGWDAEGRMHWNLDPEGQFNLRFDEVESTKMHLRLEWILNGRLMASEFSLEDIPVDEPFEVFWDGEDWISGTGSGDPPTIGLRFWWRGERFQPPAPQEVDPELMQQLEALGYI